MVPKLSSTYGFLNCIKITTKTFKIVSKSVRWVVRWVFWLLPLWETPIGGCLRRENQYSPTRGQGADLGSRWGFVDAHFGLHVEHILAPIIMAEIRA